VRPRPRVIIRTAWIAAAWIAMAGAAGISAAGAQALSADLSSHVIGITTGFVGADLVLFGATDRPGDVAVIVRGPPAEITVRRKKQVLGVWVNGSSVVFHDAPGFYAAAASRPLNEIADPDLLARHGIGLNAIRLQAVTPMAEPELAAFRAALVASQEGADLYRKDIARVTFLGERLFRADMAFPANVPTGNYSVEVDLFSGGQLVGAQTTSLIVSRIGFSNGVFTVAHRHAVWYGLGALAFAVIAGWAASAVFRRV
jgi:uncharacterized protein (TIGR02186 family)